MKTFRNLRTIFTDLFIIALLFSVWANQIIGTRTDPFISSDLDALPQTKVGLLLGTSRNLKNGSPNLYFFNRIDAAVKLYKSGKIKYILVSGDNGNEDYNEPRDMQNELVLRGVPLKAIYLDYAGFRTLDSVLRAYKVFGQKQFIVISQKFHNERAVFLARKMNIEAYGYNAEDVNAYYGFKTKCREFLARTKVFVDLFFKVEPKFLGEKIIIG